MCTVPATLTFTFLSYPIVCVSYPIVRLSYPIVYHVKVNVAGTVLVLAILLDFLAEPLVAGVALI